MASVLSDDSCNCFGGIPVVPSPNPADAIVVRHKPGTVTGNVINKYAQSGKTIYELDDLVLVKPVLTLTNDQSAVKEVGANVAVVNFSGSVVQGTHLIASRTLTPDPGGVNLFAPFTFQKVNVTRTTPGAAQLHTLQATDGEGNVSIAQSSVPFKHAFYRGYNQLSVLDQVAIKALANKTLVDSIISSYGGSHSYVVPAGLSKYIYLSGPVGTPIPVGALISGLALPLYFGHANVNVTNIFGQVISYWVVRTANKFDPGTYQIELS